MNPRISFYVWLTSQKVRLDEVGRLASEVDRDQLFPQHCWRLHLFLRYYTNNPRNRRAVKLAHAEWREFRKVAA